MNVREIESTDRGETVYDHVVAPQKDPATVQRRRQLYLRTVSDAHSRVFGITAGDTIVGTGAVSVDRGHDALSTHLTHPRKIPDTTAVVRDEEPFGYLSSLYVHPDFHGRGYGGRLYDTCESYAQSEADCIVVEVWAHDGHDACELLENRGLRAVFASPTYWQSSVDPDVECAVCGFDCTCSGQVWRKSFY